MGSEEIGGFGMNKGEIDIQAFVKQAPGMVVCCKADKMMELCWLSDSFYSQCGYCAEEIKTLYQNHFANLIMPEDRDRVYQAVLHAAEKDGIISIEYGILRKNGKPMWVLDKGRVVKLKDGRTIVYSSLMDVSEENKAREELKMCLERYQIIMNQTNDIMFEWNIQTDTLEFSSNWKNKFKYLPLQDHFYEDFLTNSHIHSDDKERFALMLERIRQGVSYAEEEVRVCERENRYIWCRVRMTALFDDEGQPVRAVGVILDIDNEKRSAQKLLEKAQRDTLTKLYNKGTAQSMIEDALLAVSEVQKHALMIIDVDDFKKVNDTMGHLCGDAFLVEIAGEMMQLFRTTDVVGRVGGDEFIVFMKDISDQTVAARKAGEILKAFSGIVFQNEEMETVSCSIGISVYPDDGTVFQELYKNADLALYHAKKIGKNQYCFYENVDAKEEIFGTEAVGRTAVNELIDSNQDIEGTLNSRLVEYVFRILYKTLDIERAIDPILEIVGRQFNVNRVYIFENTEDNKHCCNTFEWCDNNTKPEIQNLKFVSYEDDLGGNYLNNFDENGIFYCRDIRELPTLQREILEPQGIKSILQCVIRDNGEIKGYVGFDECRINRFWTQEQVSALSFIAEILSTFLMKKRAEDRGEQTRDSLKTALDNQNAWIYVVSLETYEILYLNQKTMELAPESRIGMRCHDVFFHREEPCPECPVRKLLGGIKNYTAEIYNPCYDLWLAADATLIPWRGKESCMISSRDITKYKRADKEKQE